MERALYHVRTQNLTRVTKLYDTGCSINYFSLGVFCLVARGLYHDNITGVNTHLTFNVFIIPR